MRSLRKKIMFLHTLSARLTGPSGPGYFSQYVIGGDKLLFAEIDERAISAKFLPAGGGLDLRFRPRFRDSHQSGSGRN